MTSFVKRLSYVAEALNGADLDASRFTFHVSRP
jgi:hypothetical protein